MTFGKTLSETIKLTRIDSSNLSDHSNLTEEDECYFLLEYTSGKNYAYGKTNSLITNLKKKPSRSSPAEIRYKKLAINQCSSHFSKAINMRWLADATLVPIPPSKINGHPDYDNRITQICQEIASAEALDIRELVIQSKSLDASHEGNRHSVETLLNNYSIDESLSLPQPSKIAIFDDMLTAGSHYRAMHTILRQRFPGVRIVGFFVARRIFSNPFEVIDSLDNSI